MMDKVNDEKVKNWILLDVYPYSLGVKTVGGVMKAFTKRNTYCFIAEITRDFTTYYDNQTCAYVEFYEGEKPLVEDNIYIGKINLDGIPPMPRGKLQIQIKLKIDESFNFFAEVKEKSTGNNNSEISKNKGLTGCFDQPLIDEDNFMNYQNMMNNMNYSNMMNNMNMINNMNRLII
jgi:molecular chaperone DnaK (HSP70)